MSITKATNSGLVGTKYNNVSADNYYMEPIASVLVGSGGQASISFTNIPQIYKHLQIRGISKANAAGNGYSMIGYVGSDQTTGNYYSHYMLGDGGSASAGSYQTTGGAYFIGTSTGTGTDANWLAPLVIDVLDYNSVTKNKTFRYLTGQDRNGAGNMTFGSALWMNTAPISSLTFAINGANFAEKSRLSLYGIRG